MVEECGGRWAGCSVIVDQLGPEGHVPVGPVRALLSYDELLAVRPDGP